MGRVKGHHHHHLTEPAHLPLALFAVLLYLVTLSLAKRTRAFGYSSRSMAPFVGLLLFIHIFYGCSLFCSLFGSRWPSSAYWLSIGVSWLSIVGSVLTALSNVLPFLAALPVLLSQSGKTARGYSGAVASTVEAGGTIVFGMASEVIGQLFAICLSVILYHLWWALEPRNWLMTSNCIALYFGWAVMQTFNFIPALIDSASRSSRSLAGFYLFEVVKLSLFVWVVHSRRGGHGVRLFIGFGIAYLLGLVALIKLKQNKQIMLRRQGNQA